MSVSLEGLATTIDIARGGLYRRWTTQGRQKAEETTILENPTRPTG
jgi:hypothetical protein